MYWHRKRITQSDNQSDNQISAEEKQNTWECLFVPKRKPSYSKIFASQKLVKLVAKSKLIQTKDFWFLLSKCICGSKVCSTSLSPFFFRFDEINLSVRIQWAFMLSNLAVWFVSNTVWYKFCDIGNAFKPNWDPVDYIFSSWILSSWLLCNHKLRASNFKHEDSNTVIYKLLGVVRQNCLTSLSDIVI